MWLNVDFPTKKLTLHENTCIFIPSKESKHKGIYGFLRDGGWLYFDTRYEALIETAHKHPGFACGSCMWCASKDD
ncbi:hypothetical protein [Aquibacillus salsiterrae]|uniref:Uncharacterized protein n=1 Tax=Aquibacillus salsiterrae TaxID=2950439 RepID=A0A9X4AGX9_9BACI|nr:hypothetical protein [Aquibacillus salsiterrae]MDC3417593.1 hypothetical protein [Aquibacillus salsiterrae]